MIYGNQVRAARGLLDWTVLDLSAKSGLQPNTITAFENSTRPATAETVTRLTQALESAGIEFTPTGVQMTSPLYSFTGERWFIELLQDIEKSGAQNVVIQNADDRKTSPEILEAMRTLYQKGVSFRLTIEEGNTHLTLPVKSYRWLPSAYFKNWVTVIYGDHVAFSIQNETGCRVIHDSDLAASMTNQFNLVWDLLKPLNIESTAHDRIK